MDIKTQRQEINKRYYQKNKEKMNQKSKEYYYANLSKDEPKELTIQQENRQRYYQKNKDEIIQKAKDYYQANKERLKQKRNERYKKQLN